MIRVGQYRTQEQRLAMKKEEKRNTIICKLRHVISTPEEALQVYDIENNKELGTCSIFWLCHILLQNKIRSMEELSEMTIENMRNTLVVELSNITNTSIDTLQSYHNDQLCKLMPVGIKFHETASFDKYVAHYLKREAQKENEDRDGIAKMSPAEKKII